MFNSFGNIFRITTFGESHGVGVGVVIDGCPAGHKLDLEQLQSKINQRKPGQSKITTSRKEEDIPEILSGIFNGYTTGAPLTFFVRNTNSKPSDYDKIKEGFRPSHADYTYTEKYGLRDFRGGGRSSARETLARVIGGAIAEQILSKISTIRIKAWVSQAGQVSLSSWPKEVVFSTQNQKMVRCPDKDIADQMVAHILEIKKMGDSIGGIISCSIEGLKTGIGEPIYHKLNAVLGSAMLGINAVKGFEIGSGFRGASMRGSEHNDLFEVTSKGVGTKTNNSGGVQGGISNGEPLNFRLAFKPTSTIMKPQETIDVHGKPYFLEPKGRHDPCVVPRAVPIVEAMAALVLLDYILLGKGRTMEDLNS